MAKHQGIEVKLARTVDTAEAGVPVSCHMCDRELLVAQVDDTPVVCEKCWDLLEGKDIASLSGFDLGI
jgi:hypothetical protein